MLQAIKTTIVPRKQVKHINSSLEVKEMVKLSRQLPLSHISIDFKFTYDCQEVYFKDKFINDIRSIHPVRLAIVLAAPPSRSKATLHQFVVDLSNPQLVSALKRLFTLPVPFVGYDLKPAYFCLWRLGLPEPATVWDGRICEQALHLGRYHEKYAPQRESGVVGRINAKNWSHEQVAIQTSLMYACQRHGVPYQTLSSTADPYLQP